MLFLCLKDPRVPRSGGASRKFRGGEERRGGKDTWLIGLKLLTWVVHIDCFPPLPASLPFYHPPTSRDKLTV